MNESSSVGTGSKRYARNGPSSDRLAKRATTQEAWDTDVLVEQTLQSLQSATNSSQEGCSFDSRAEVLQTGVHDPENEPLSAPEIYHTRSSLSAIDSSIQTSVLSSRRNSLDSEKTVCFGMIFEVHCQQLSRAHSLRREQLINSSLDHKYVSLHLKFEDDRCTICLSDSHALANLNQRTATALKKLKDVAPLKTRAYGLASDLTDTFTSGPPNKKNLRTVKVHINVYGSKDQAVFVGQLLSDHDLFLQDPIYDAFDTEYYNPHILVFNGISDIDVWLEELALDAKSAGQVGNHLDWGVVLDNLSQYQTSSLQVDNSSLKATLMRHQLDGQDFMLNRELGTIDDNHKYWHPSVNDNGSSVYRHIVTMAERSYCPPEPRGGILADDMGLGKTLTTLSVIASSLCRAAAFSSGYAHRVVANGITVSPTKATLVVAPSLLILDSWSREIERQVRPGSLKSARYHGHERVQHFSELLDYDIVFTTFGTITTEFRKMRSRKVLYYLSWFRIVLDEAHTIRSQNTKQFEAVISLQAEHHWCLTGTPISNKVEDLGALLRFCRVPLLEERSWFQEGISKVAKRSFTRGCQAVQTALAPLSVFSENELKQYKNILKNSKQTLEANLRIFCNHGTFMSTPNQESEDHLDPYEEVTLLQEKEEACCSNCQCEIALINQFQDPSTGTALDCPHVFCSTCFQENALGRQSDCFVCSICDKEVFKKQFKETEVPGNREASAHKQQSSKLDKLLENLNKSKCHGKSLIFSSWKKTIDLASQLCNAQDIKHVCIDGTTPQAERSRALTQFINDDSTSALLLTLGTGALGLNLTAATHVHILEPQWNPSVEEQAIGRAIRIGQENEITIIRYLVEDSVEKHIQTYQKRKILLAAGGFGDASETSLEDVQTRLLTATFLRESG